VTAFLPIMLLKPPKNCAQPAEYPPEAGSPGAGALSRPGAA